MRDFPAIKIAFIGLGLALLLSHIASAQRAGDEITLPAETFKKLDTFEALNLEDADKLYIKKDYKGAFAAYKAFSFEFPKSRATSYVLLRMGRCLHLLDKRHAAITSYQDVVNYFPDDLRHAAAAMFYIGQCHGQNGDVEKQTAVWARMVKDDGYVTQPNSGTALTHLGNAMEKLGKYEEAAGYQWRTAVAFLNSNPGAASEARQSVIKHYTLRQPNMEKLAEFYVAASGFDGRGAGKTPPAELAEFWQTALSTALRSEAGETRTKACAYWTGKMGDRFGDRDDLRKLWCDAQLVHEKDAQAWLGRMEKLYAAKPTTLDRVLQWCEYYRIDP
ncbi:MAG TPA: tetratricopeptide repeat protein, partial [Luteolibacter sp.]|nr:tetratricopeptide repeat protein [Luteolibacter sp.]